MCFFEKDSGESSSFFRKDRQIFISLPDVKIRNSIDYYMPILFDTMGYKLSFLGEATIDYSEVANGGIARLGAYGQQSNTELIMNVDSFLVGREFDTWNNRSISIGGMNGCRIEGNFLGIYNHWLVGGWSNDTLKHDVIFKFDESDWILTDVTFAPPSIIDAEFRLEFGDLFVRNKYYAIDNIYLDNGRITLKVDKLHVEKYDAGSQLWLTRGAYSNASRVMLNSEWVFDIGNGRMNGIGFSQGLSVRQSQHTGNKFIVRGTFNIDGVPLFRNTADANVGEDQIIYYLDNVIVDAKKHTYYRS